MNYTQKVLEHPLFNKIQKEISELEAGRIYCHHELAHALDVCRIAWILFLEDHCGQKIADAMQRDRIYVAGLLHDIGRAAQYTTGVHHSIAGIPLAEEILNDIGCPEDWKQETLEIVSEHWGREEKGLEPDSTAYYIDRADHLSRNCFACAASDTCKWKEEDKNRRLLC